MDIEIIQQQPHRTRAEAAKYISAFWNGDRSPETKAATVAAIQDVCVRDYAMTMHLDDELTEARLTWAELAMETPVEYMAPIATMLSVLAYEAGDLTTAMLMSLSVVAMGEEEQKQMAKLVLQGLELDFPAQGMVEMRHKLRAAIIEKVS